MSPMYPSTEVTARQLVERYPLANPIISGEGEAQALYEIRLKIPGSSTFAP